MQRYLQPPVLCLIVGTVFLQTGCQGLFNRQQDAAEPTEIPATEIANRSPVSSNLIVKMVNEVGPAVVQIDTARTRTNLFNQFEQRQSGSGSGFIFDETGLILTNAHVVEDAEEVTVTLKDGQQYAGTVEGQDPLTDIAVIKIEADQLPALTLGDSDNLKSGDWAIAIGNPLGLSNTVTMGIISATDRPSNLIGAPDQRVNFIQTDAAINPGNSGGPLLNLKGEVIGINTAILRGSPESEVAAQGLGFAIPVQTAKQISQKLLKDGAVAHPYLGIRMASITQELKTSLQEESELQVQQDKGVLVIDVLSKSPAATAKLKAGDVITKIGKTTIDNTDQLQQVLQSVTPGDQLAFTIVRDDSEQQVQLTVGTLKPETFSRRS